MTQTSASDRKDIVAAQKAARVAAVARGDVLRDIMRSPTGREWVWDRLSAANVFSSVYSENPTRMAFLEGHRNAGLDLLNDVMEHCPDQFIQAMREANARRTADRADAERRSGTGRNGDDSRSDLEGGRNSAERFVLDPDAPGGYRIAGPEVFDREEAEPSE